VRQYLGFRILLDVGIFVLGPTFLL
jgi:hypothetical protein